MDSLAHTLFGAVLAQTGLARRYGRGTTLTLILASNAPDIDALWAFTQGPDSFLLRRTLTHSLLVLPILALLLSFLMRLFYRNQKLGGLFFLCLLGIGAHLFFDLLNSYGVVLFYPLSLRRFELAWIFIADIPFWLILTLPFLIYVASRHRISLDKSARVSVACLGLYIGLCGYAHHLAERRLAAVSKAENLSPDFSYVFPEVFGPQRFRGVLRQGLRYRMYLINLLDGSAELKYETITEDGNPVVRRVRQTALGQRVDWFSMTPVWKVERGVDVKGKSGEIVTVFDLRFRSLVFGGPRKRFSLSFDAEGRRLQDEAGGAY